MTLLLALLENTKKKPPNEKVPWHPHCIELLKDHAWRGDGFHCVLFCCSFELTFNLDVNLFCSSSTFSKLCQNVCCSLSAWSKWWINHLCSTHKKYKFCTTWGTFQCLKIFTRIIAWADVPGAGTELVQTVGDWTIEGVFVRYEVESMVKDYIMICKVTSPKKSKQETVNFHFGMFSVLS